LDIGNLLKLKVPEGRDVGAERPGSMPIVDTDMPFFDQENYRKTMLNRGNEVNILSSA
jgi:hypothetical protein